MNVMIIGSGGREHALAWKVKQSPKVDSIFVVPGNAGTSAEEGIENISMDISDFNQLEDFAKNNNVDLTIVGPEAPLVDGIVDHFVDAGLRCFGPSKGAAQLEGSKAFSKDFLKRHNIPTAQYANFTEVSPALEYLQTQSMPIVIKADGLAAGKGVIIAQNLEEAQVTVSDMLSGNSFGDAGHRVVIEEFMQGEEASFIVIVDGSTVLPFATSQDHKARDDGDTGPNTGGMGAYSPAPVVTPEIHDRIMQEVVLPTVKGMASEGNNYTGFLYAGLMIDSDGNPRVVEYNCRFGDPEAQPIMMRLKTDLVELCDAAIDKTLETISIEFDQRAAMGVVLAAGGYPNAYKKGDVIDGLASADGREDAKIFHAGTQLVDSKVLTNGGRVLCVTSLGDSVGEAQRTAYELLSQVSWNEVYYRRDIGYRAIARENSTH